MIKWELNNISKLVEETLALILDISVNVKINNINMVGSIISGNAELCFELDTEDVEEAVSHTDFHLLHPNHQKLLESHIRAIMKKKYQQDVRFLERSKLYRPTISGDTATQLYHFEFQINDLD